ncbi:MAG: acylphosphatase [Pseudomonadota bacterium]
MTVALKIAVTGRVQGVGFRYWTRERATALGLSGWVRNEPDGSVSALIAGHGDAVEQMLSDFWGGPPPAAVEHVESEPSEECPTGPFEIRR